jgi:hypothetical protein
MKLKITPEFVRNAAGDDLPSPHYAALAAALAAAHGRATSHTARPSNLRPVAERLEAQLAELGIAKRDRAGATARYVSGDKVPSSYKYARTVSVVDMTRGSSGWYVTAIARPEVWPSAKTGARLILTPEQDAIAVATLRSRYTVAARAAVATA